MLWNFIYHIIMINLHVLLINVLIIVVFGGWEINVDEDTVHYYQSLNSPFGKEIIDNLDYTDEYCFKLKDGHCPF